MTAIRSPAPMTAGTQLLGEVISWTCSGVTVTHAALMAALKEAGLDENVARELAPRHAFTRASPFRAVPRRRPPLPRRGRAAG